MYIFVVMLTPTTASPGAHLGIIIDEDIDEAIDEDMALWATLGALTSSMLATTRKPAAIVFIYPPS